MSCGDDAHREIQPDPPRPWPIFNSGFIRRSEIFEGNVSEAGTLPGMLAGLGAPGGALVIMDAGIATGENIAWLVANGYKYLVVSRERKRGINESWQSLRDILEVQRRVSIT